jgi:thymidylate synthase
LIPAFLDQEEYKLLNIFREIKNNPDYTLAQFDQNLQTILDHGHYVLDRTGKGCKYLPGITTIDISKRIPIPTRRRTAWKSMLKEYLWFLTGSSQIQDLRNMGSKVWDSWEDDDWAHLNGFPDSSIGYGYGTNLIHFGCDLTDMENNPGFNQIDFIINELKTNPNSRRILFNFYRPDKSGKNDVKLPPCHVMYQFIPTPDENGNMTKLSCCVYQRSSDMFVGNLSTNLQGAAFYTHMIAQQVGMVPDKLFHFSGHAHIYMDHIELVKEYLDRPFINSPILKLNKKESIYDYVADDFELMEYHPAEKMNVPISV